MVILIVLLRVISCHKILFSQIENKDNDYRWAFTSPMIYTPHAFHLLAKEKLSVKNDQSFRAHFGTSADVCSILWDNIRASRRCPRCIRPIHLLWSLLFLKTYDTTDVLAARVNTSPNTLRKWVWIVLRLIQKLKRKVVRVHYFASIAHRQPI